MQICFQYVKDHPSDGCLRTPISGVRGCCLYFSRQRKTEGMMHIILHTIPRSNIFAFCSICECLFAHRYLNVVASILVHSELQIFSRQNIFKCLALLLYIISFLVCFFNKRGEGKSARILFAWLPTSNYYTPLFFFFNLSFRNNNKKNKTNVLIQCEFNSKARNAAARETQSSNFAFIVVAVVEMYEIRAREREREGKHLYT